MATRIRGPGPKVGSAGAQQAERGEGAGSIREQVEDNLFGQKKPPPLDEDYEEVWLLLQRLDVYRKKLANIAGDDEEDYQLVLAAGPIPTIDRHGKIFVGREFLLEYAEALDAQVGVLAHEVGHRPHRWDELRQEQKLTRAEGEELCRTEEIRADMFAGYSLSQLGLRYEPLIEFLQEVNTHPHEIYVDVQGRIETIREAFEAGLRRSDQLKKMFPEFARMTSAKHDLGKG